METRETTEQSEPRTRRADPAFYFPVEQRGLDESKRPSLDSKSIVVSIFWLLCVHCLKYSKFAYLSEDC